jgi:lauroyl/myristoyl acyltransferase
MKGVRSWRQSFAVRGVSWRHGLDWAIVNVPFYFHPFLVSFWTLFFFFFARRERKAVLSHLAVILPGSWRVMNYLRAFRVFSNFAWTLTEATVYKLNKAPFACELSGAEFFDELLAGKGAIILTAHMGSYDLGAALFATRFQREIRVVRAPELDAGSAHHVDLALKSAGAGAVKVDYSTEGAALSFDLLNALRNGETVSIQGDRVVGEMASAPARLFGRRVCLPSGPFILALVAPVMIYPLFVIRRGHRRYKIVVREPIHCTRTARAREDDIASAITRWAKLLEALVLENWNQWYAFTPIFQNEERE